MDAAENHFALCHDIPHGARYSARVYIGKDIVKIIFIALRAASRSNRYNLYLSSATRALYEFDVILFTQSAPREMYLHLEIFSAHRTPG